MSLYDVIVVGGGNAGLCAAISAAEEEAQVLLVDVAPTEWRGGNSQHTRNVRVAHTKPTNILVDSYSVDEYWDDLKKVTKGNTNENLARLTIEKSQYLCQWLEARGILFQNSISGTLSLSRTNAFFYGGGKTLVNSEYLYAQKVGVDILYQHEVIGINLIKKKFNSVTVKTATETKTIYGKSLVAASGGFESNYSWLEEIWGKKARNFIIRGTRFNKGKVLRSLLSQGIASVGKPDQCHAVAIDGRSPQYDGGIVTRLDCVPFGIVINDKGERFYDEGENFWPKRYAIWGRLIAQQPNQIAHVIIDSRSLNLFMPSVFPPETANSIPILAKKLHLNPNVVLQTIEEYNQKVVPGTFNPNELDDCHTKGLNPNKTHWARTINQPPYYAYTLRPGITFTYLGVKVNEEAQIIMKDGSLGKGLFAAGEIMAGNILGQGYLAGFGMAIGCVFGILAGQGAARYAKHTSYTKTVD